jgi:hypothetical protein
MAQVQIPNLPAATLLSGAEQLEIVQAGTSARATTQAVGNAATSWAQKGANSDITSLSGLTGDISLVGSIQFDTALGTVPAEGRITWDPVDDTLFVGMNGGGVTQRVGFQNFYRVKASGAITKGQVIMAVGAVGNSGVIEASLATGLGVNDGQYVIGIASQSISNNNFGYVTAFGLVEGIQTNGANYGEVWIDGTILWYDPTVVGGLTSTTPSAPNPKVLMAIVINANPSNGSLFVRVTAGSVFGGTDGNVDLSTPVDGEVITYNSSTQIWTDSGVRMFSGAGSPEGVVTAPVGALYTRTDGGAGTTLYVKESGAGNTGWVAK